MEPSIRDKAAVAGIGQTRFSRSLGLSELEMAVEAIWKACDDADISPSEIDGLVRCLGVWSCAWGVRGQRLSMGIMSRCRGRPEGAPALGA